MYTLVQFVSQKLRYGAFAVLLLTHYSCRSPADESKSKSENLDQGTEAYCAAQSKNPLPEGRKPGPTCQELVAKFPSVGDPNTPEDKRIICPFMRILKRSGLLEEEIAKNLKAPWAKDAVFPVSVLKLIGFTNQLGCQGIACAAVAEQAAMSQNKNWPALTVDIGKLFAAPPRDQYKNRAKQQRASHDCGFTFQFGDESVNDEVRSATLSRFKAIAEQNQGQIKLADIVQVKKEMCKRDYAIYQGSGLNAFSPVDDKNQTLLADASDKVEVSLIWIYLGGVDNGFIRAPDLDRFFHASFPAHKTRYFLDLKLLGEVMKSHEEMW